jgi:hypothetical protein
MKNIFTLLLLAGLVFFRLLVDGKTKVQESQACNLDHTTNILNSKHVLVVANRGGGIVNLSNLDDKN